LSDDFGTREAAKAALIASIDELLPRVAELVHNPRYRQKYHEHVLTPLRELHEVLRKAGRSEAIPAIGSLLDDPDVEVRQDAARTLGNLGHDKCIPWLRKAFADPEGSVRSAALSDLMYGAEKPMCSDAFRRALAEEVVNFLRHPEQEESYGAATALLALDRQRAFAILLDGPYFTPQYPQLSVLLQHLNFGAIRLPEEKVLRLIERLRASAGSDDRSYPYALEALSRSGSVRAFDLIHEELVRQFDGEPFDQPDRCYAEAGQHFYWLAKALGFANDGRATRYLVQLFRTAEREAIHDIWHPLRQRSQRVDAGAAHSVVYWGDLWQLTHDRHLVEFRDEQQAVVRWLFDSEEGARKLYDTLQVVPFRCEMTSGKLVHVFAYPHMIEDLELLYKATGSTGMPGDVQVMIGPPLEMGDDLWQQRD
jgi:hypothetical protein